ncbi:MAG: hypothetical protein NTY86_01925 [Deltaproteobacteria bacterium]|nr:hypothetical protein [Deltaproteobacteria bacterium]
MKSTSNWLAMLSFVFLILLSSTAHSQMNEKAKLRDSLFGDYTKAKIEKKMGKSTLQVWEPHIKYSNTLPPLMKEVMLNGVEKLQVEYDEIWKAEYDSIFTAAEKKKWKGQFDRTTLYWKDNKIQAYTVEKSYLSDPSTGKKLPNPSHKVTSIYDRAAILNKLSGK